MSKAKPIKKQVLAVKKKGVIKKTSNKTSNSTRDAYLQSLEKVDASSFGSIKLHPLTFYNTKKEPITVMVSHKPEKEIHLTLDEHNHPAWNKNIFSRSTTGKSKKFEQKFGKL